MQKIEIRSFTDKDFRKEYGIPLELSVDPEQISFGKNIFYREDKQLGSTGGDNRIHRYPLARTDHDRMSDL